MAVGTGSGRPFVGRLETVEALRRRFEDARAGAGGVTLLVGDTGVGKSTLLEELVEEFRARGVLVLRGRSLALDDPPPFSLIRAAIESARDDPSLRSADTKPLGGDSILIGFAPGFDDRTLPAPVSIETRLLEALGGTDVRTDVSRERVLEEIADRLLEYAEHGPTVLVLEDLHRADESSLSVVELLGKQVGNARFWVLGSSRPLLSLSGPARARLERFESATRAQRLVLRPMNPGEVAEYFRSSDPSREVPVAEVERRYAETGGNPLLLDQLDRRAATAEEVPDPPALDPESQRVLDVAAALGPEFSFDLLYRASGEEDEERLTETVERLVDRGLLFERAGEVLEFPEDRLREAAYNQLPERRRRILHRRAGEAVEASGPVDSAGVYALARHFYRGHDGPRSVKYNRMAAQIAERALAPETAWDHYSRALESQLETRPSDPDAEAALVLDLARITEELGLLQDAETILRDFLDRETGNPLLSLGRRVTLELFLARVRSDRGEMPAAAEIAQQILDTPGLDDQLLVRVGAHHQLGMALYYVGRYAEALAQHTEEVRLARETGNELVIARAQVWRVADLAMMGETQQAIAEAREVTAARDRVGSVRESAQAHLYFADILADSRSTPAQRQEAIHELSEAIRFAEMAKDPRRVGWASYKTAELLREAGRLDEASASAERAQEILARVGDRAGVSVSLKVHGQIAMDRGDYEAAAADLGEARRTVEGLNRTLEELDILFRLAELSKRKGDDATARELLTELEQRDLATKRPDLVDELNRLKSALALAEGDGRAP